MRKKRAKKSQRTSNNRYRSGFESKLANQLKRSGVDFEYETLKIEYRKVSTYTPDFILPNGIIIEAKGVWTVEDRKKHLFIKSQYPDIDIRFVFDNPYRKLYKGGKMTYADWCNKYGYQFCKLNEGIPQEWLDKADVK